MMKTLKQKRKVKIVCKPQLKSLKMNKILKHGANHMLVILDMLKLLLKDNNIQEVKEELIISIHRIGLY